MIDHQNHNNELSDFCLQIADEAGKLGLEYFRKTLAVEHKADLTPVTIADRSVEAAMRKRILARFPDHGIFGEEHGMENSDAERTWIIDPIDGTKSFITGMPTYGTLICYLEHNKPIVGVIDIPAMGERWLGIAGQPARFNGDICKTSKCVELSKANIYTTSPDMFDTKGWQAFERVTNKASLRRFGGDCYAYGLLASGHIEAVIEMELEPYDYMALIPVVECAGGVISDWQGNTLDKNSDGHVIAAANEELHREILSLLQM